MRASGLLLRPNPSDSIVAVLVNAAPFDAQDDSVERNAQKLLFEQPLNERIRALLRLEHLLQSIETRINGSSEWDARAALAGLIDVADVLWRSDIKGELIKEMDRHAGILQRLRASPGVDAERLHDTLATLEGLLRKVKNPSYQPGQILRRDELASAVKQRLAIPGGTCSFDVPAYHYWLNRAGSTRIAQLNRWFEEFSLLQDGIDIVLKLIRNSVDPTPVVALGGLFQQSLDPNASYQLIRVQVPMHLGLFPEISAGKFRFTLRFMEQPNTTTRPSQTTRDVYFELQSCCL